MESLVVFDAKFENTRRIAEAIADGLRSHGPVRLLPLDELPPHSLGSVDLLFVGGPITGNAMTAHMERFVDVLEAGPATGMLTAIFDTGFRMPAVLSESAAMTIAGKLWRAGIRTFAPPESFFASRGEPELEEGEIERATNWAKSVVARLELSLLCAT